MRRQSAYAAAMTAIEARKCSPTTHGLRLVSTVMPPMTAWAGMPNSTPTASGSVPRRRGRWASTASTTASAMIPTAKVSSRLPNSITPCTPISAVVV